MDTVLDKAAAIVDGPRSQAYGRPAANFALIARLWAEVLGVVVTPQQVGLCMIQVKVARLSTSPAPQLLTDSLVDIAGYARCIERLDEC
jgi:hypothetical protein